MKLELEVKQEVGLLAWNFEALNKQLDEALKKYEGLVFTEDQITEAKQTRANLNNAKKAIDERRKEIKRTFCQPYTDFEAQVKELTGKIDRVSLGIADQLDAFEAKRKEEKKAEIEAWYEENGLAYLELDRIFNQKWLNKTCSTDAWQKELTDAIDKVVSDMRLCGELNASDPLRLKTLYLRSLNLDDALKTYRAEEEAKKALEQAKEAVTAVSAPKEVDSPHTEEKPSEQAETLYTRTFTVMNCTREQIINLGNYMNANGIKFRKGA